MSSERIGDGSGVALRMREDDGALSFELVADSDRVDEALVRLRDRIEALGGRVGIHVDPGGTPGSTVQSPRNEC